MEGIVVKDSNIESSKILLLSVKQSLDIFLTKMETYT